MLQREDGTYWLAWTREGTVLVSSSTDGNSWSAPTEVMRGMRQGISRMSFHETAEGDLYVAASPEAIMASSSSDGTNWSRPKVISNWREELRVRGRGWWLTQDGSSLFHLIGIAQPAEATARVVFLCRSDSADGFDWPEEVQVTPLDKGHVEGGKTCECPITGSADPLLLIDREGTFHVFNRYVRLYHSCSLDGSRWTPWQRISTTMHTRLGSVIQDRSGAFWFAGSTSDAMERLFGKIQVATVKGFDRWGTIAE
jgi:hypothetical protein